VAWLSGWFGAAAALATDGPASVENGIFFRDQVRPLLERRCFACHGGEKIKGGLRLSRRSAIIAGGELGPAVDLEHPEKSLLLAAIQYEGPEMPPEGRLPADEIAILQRWVELGLPWHGPDDLGPQNAAPHGSPDVDDTARRFWSFQPVSRPPSPSPGDTAWAATPIDLFIRASLEDVGLAPNPAAQRAVLLRRAYYDLCGLPPTPEDVTEFEADDSPLAWPRVVDRLIASPHYGERWARHWLDLVRYAETNSYERDGDKPFVWRYRDYVIQSFNSDKPYNEFVVEQLAGDELHPRTPDRLIATGYYRLGIWDDEPSQAEQALYDDLDDIVSTTGQVFLGLTINCARCHEHKLDPIPQRDYYRMLAFFAGFQRFGVRSPKSVAEASLRSIAGTENEQQQVLCITEVGARPRDTHLLIRGNPQSLGEPIQPGFPSVLDPDEPSLPAPPAGAATCGRRAVLARWIASDENPLTARVMVNRIWQYHFGRGLVRSPSNFGFQGDRPTHPELLDWLARELVDKDWRLKPLHRRILLSNAYQMSSQDRVDGVAVDPENDRFWRFDMRRLEGEELRDSILLVSGELNRAMYGPSMCPVIEPDVLAGQSQPGSGWDDSSYEQRCRRSVYIKVKRSLQVPLLASFDSADLDASCPVRSVTTQPGQALVLLNSGFANEQARVFAARVEREAGLSVREQVTRALELALQRSPREAEIERGMGFILDAGSAQQPDRRGALVQFCLLVFNLNEFMYLP
jgi:hypothetical protein